jgi:hypothetical protein
MYGGEGRAGLTSCSRTAIRMCSVNARSDGDTQTAPREKLANYSRTVRDTNMHLMEGLASSHLGERMEYCAQ